MTDDADMTGDAERKWWAVAALYKNNHPNKKSRYLSRRVGERRVFLVHAESQHEAERLGAQIAQEQEHQYRAFGDELISVKLQKVECVLELLDAEMGHGAEVYWDWIVEDKRHRKPQIT